MRVGLRACVVPSATSVARGKDKVYYTDMHDHRNGEPSGGRRPPVEGGDLTRGRWKPVTAEFEGVGVGGFGAWVYGYNVR